MSTSESLRLRGSPPKELQVMGREAMDNELEKYKWEYEENPLVEQ